MKQILIISTLFFVACTGARKAGKGKVSKELSAAETIKLIEANEVSFETLNANLSFNIDSEVFSGGANAKLRMVRDSVIWLSASKLGFEVGRMMITRDSVFALERLQKTYIKESIDQLAKLAGFEIDFDMAQQILFGNAYLHPVENEVLYYPSDSLQVIPGFEEIKIRHLLDRNDFRLQTTRVWDETTKTEAILDFEDYKTDDLGHIFSYLRRINVDNENEVEIVFKNTEFNTEKSIQFSIPSSYSPRQF